jgi:hypothetical protein
MMGLPNTVDACRYDEHSIGRFEQLYADLDRSSWSWLLDSGRLDHPDVPAEALQSAINVKISELSLDVPHRSVWWHAIVADFRDEFAHCGFFLQVDCDVEPRALQLFAPMYVAQRPRVLHFLKAALVDEDGAEGLADALALRSADYGRVAIWATQLGDVWASEDEVCSVEDCTLWVVPRLVFAGRFLISRSTPVEFEEYTRGMKQSKRKSEKTDDDKHVLRAGLSIIAKIQEEYPWLTADDLAAALAARASSSSTSKPAAGAPSKPADGSGAMPDGVEAVEAEDVAVDAEEVLAELHAEREKWEWDEAGVHENFFVYQRGSVSTAAKKGVALDCVTCNARQHMFIWCKRVGCNRIRSFAFAEHGGQYNCNIFAREWCRKQEYFYNAWCDELCPIPYDFSMLPEFVLSEEFLDVSLSVPVESSTFKRVLELKNWLPLKLVALA